MLSPGGPVQGASSKTWSMSSADLGSTSLVRQVLSMKTSGNDEHGARYESVFTFSVEDTEYYFLMVRDTDP